MRIESLPEAVTRSTGMRLLYLDWRILDMQSCPLLHAAMQGYWVPIFEPKDDEALYG